MEYEVKTIDFQWSRCRVKITFAQSLSSSGSFYWHIQVKADPYVIVGDMTQKLEPALTHVGNSGELPPSGPSSAMRVGVPIRRLVWDSVARW